jgi:uncharacterized membrane protein YeaQ/YmgE (transglycosylase-associated protein family)
MSETTQETITTSVTPVKIAATQFQTMEYLIYFLFGVLEILLAFRLVFKLTGASLSSAFIGFIYGITRIFIMPFEGIFRRAFTEGVETTSVFEPSTLVAILVYAILAWGIVKLVRVFSGERQAA